MLQRDPDLIGCQHPGCDQLFLYSPGRRHPYLCLDHAINHFAKRERNTGPSEDPRTLRECGNDSTQKKS